MLLFLFHTGSQTSRQINKPAADNSPTNDEIQLYSPVSQPGCSGSYNFRRQRKIILIFQFCSCCCLPTPTSSIQGIRTRTRRDTTTKRAAAFQLHHGRPGIYSGLTRLAVDSVLLSFLLSTQQWVLNYRIELEKWNEIIFSNLIYTSFCPCWLCVAIFRISTSIRYLMQHRVEEKLPWDIF